MNDVRFVIAKEDLALGPGNGLDQSVLLKWRRTEKASDIGIRRGAQSAPLSSLSKRTGTDNTKILPDPLPQYTF